VVTITIPPDKAWEFPAETKMSPPEPLLPEPTVKYNAPPRPPDADPDPTYTVPELPLDDEPVLTTIIPLTPDVPALLVLKRRDPLLVDDPNPVITDSRPPLARVETPAERTSSPPVPLFPDPTAK